MTLSGRRAGDLPAIVYSRAGPIRSVLGWRPQFDDLETVLRHALARLNSATIPLLKESRQLSACQNNDFVPFLKTPIPGEKDEQVVAWAVERQDGGRGFAFTGGRTRGCVPLDVRVGGQSRVRHVTLSLFAGSCGAG